MAAPFFNYVISLLSIVYGPFFYYTFVYMIGLAVLATIPSIIRYFVRG